MSCVESSISRKCFHARTAPLASAVFFAAPASRHHLRFGDLVANRNATGRIAKAQSGCLSYGSRPTTEQRKSATRHRLVSRPSCGGQRSVECRGKPPHGTAQSWLAPPLPGHAELGGTKMAAKCQYNKQPREARSCIGQASMSAVRSQRLQRSLLRSPA